MPPALARSQQTARAAAAELERTRTGLMQAEQAEQAAGGRGEAMRLSTELARAKTAFEQSQTQSDFAYLVLGRDCVAARHTPSQMGLAVTEIQRLKPHVSAFEVFANQLPSSTYGSLLALIGVPKKGEREH